MKKRKTTPEERAARKARVDYQVRKLREFATRQPGARERLEGLTDADFYPKPRESS